jgi:hypothetical protein
MLFSSFIVFDILIHVFVIISDAGIGIAMDIFVYCNKSVLKNHS